MPLVSELAASPSPVRPSVTVQPSIPAQPPTSAVWRFFSNTVILAVHLGAIYAIARGATPRLVLLAFSFYVVRMFAVTGAYHRYFSHRAFRTSRTFQFCLALLGTSAMQKGPLWWAAAHRRHHRDSDTPDDVHSPKQRGLWYAHMGWWLGREQETTDHAKVPDLILYRELRFLDRFHGLGVLLAAAVAYLLMGFDGLLWGFAVSTCLLMHATFTINSLAHLLGSRRYETSDTSRNNVWLALLTMGEGWHNNHHRYPGSANQGFFFWELDFTYYVLWILERVGLVWDLRKPPERVITEGRTAAQARQLRGQANRAQADRAQAGRIS